MFFKEDLCLSDLISLVKLVGLKVFNESCGGSSNARACLQDSVPIMF